MLENPWDCAADLTAERILTLARFVADIRDEVIDRHDEELGDTRLSLGMRAYECCRTRLNQLAETGKYSWFSILTPDGRFTFKIGEVPVRFTRNDPDQLPGRKLISSDETVEQMELFAKVTPYAIVRWFIVLDTEYNRAADAVYFVGYHPSGQVVCKWEVPLARMGPVVYDTDLDLPPPVDVPEPVVGVKKPIAPESDDQNERGCP
jgi:hypothetical protein